MPRKFLPAALTCFLVARRAAAAAGQAGAIEDDSGGYGDVRASLLGGGQSSNRRLKHDKETKRDTREEKKAAALNGGLEKREKKKKQKHEAAATAVAEDVDGGSAGRFKEKIQESAPGAEEPEEKAKKEKQKKKKKRHKREESHSLPAAVSSKGGKSETTTPRPTLHPTAHATKAPSTSKAGKSTREPTHEATSFPTEHAGKSGKSAETHEPTESPTSQNVTDVPTSLPPTTRYPATLSPTEGGLTFIEELMNAYNSESGVIVSVQAQSSVTYSAMNKMLPQGLSYTWPFVYESLGTIYSLYRQQPKSRCSYTVDVDTSSTTGRRDPIPGTPPFQWPVNPCGVNSKYVNMSGECPYQSPEEYADAYFLKPNTTSFNRLTWHMKEAACHYLNVSDTLAAQKALWYDLATDATQDQIDSTQSRPSVHNKIIPEEGQELTEAAFFWAHEGDFRDLSSYVIPATSAICCIAMQKCGGEHGYLVEIAHQNIGRELNYSVVQGWKIALDGGGYNARMAFREMNWSEVCGNFLQSCQAEATSPNMHKCRPPTAVPTLSPTLSSRPSVSPSTSFQPTKNPSPQPSEVPSRSHEPSLSSSPTSELIAEIKQAFKSDSGVMVSGTTGNELVPDLSGSIMTNMLPRGLFNNKGVVFPPSERPNVECGFTVDADTDSRKDPIPDTPSYQWPNNRCGVHSRYVDMSGECNFQTAEEYADAYFFEPFDGPGNSPWAIGAATCHQINVSDTIAAQEALWYKLATDETAEERWNSYSYSLVLSTFNEFVLEEQNLTIAGYFWAHAGPFQDLSSYDVSDVSGVDATAAAKAICCIAVQKCDETPRLPLVEIGNQYIGQSYKPDLPYDFIRDWNTARASGGWDPDTIFREVDWTEICNDDFKGSCHKSFPSDMTKCEGYSS